jgi:hypothetical protein
MTESMSSDETYTWLEKMNNASIYDGNRLAQPDEVINYKTGDGLEKAFTLANIISQRDLGKDIEITSDKNQVILKGQKEYRFESAKNIEKHIVISSPGKFSIND